MRRIHFALGLYLLAAAASALTYTVTSTADSGAGSLRQAITDANTNPGADTIAVQHRRLGRPDDHAGELSAADHGGRDDRRLHAAGVLAEHSPDQPGAEHGAADRNRRHEHGRHGCLEVQADDVTIKGLAINRCSRYQDHDDRSASGTSSSRAASSERTPRARRRSSPTAEASTSATTPTPGSAGRCPAARNLISGGTNGSNQILLGDFGQDATGTVVAGNLIGTDVTGPGRFGAVTACTPIFLTRGVEQHDRRHERGCAQRDRVGEINLGAQIDGLDAGNDLVQGNFIGIDVTGEGIL